MKQRQDLTYRELQAEEQLQRNLVVVAGCLLLSTVFACILAQVFRFIGF